MALVGTPMIVTYRVGALSSVVGRIVVRVPHVSLVNLLLGSRVVPELLQSEARPRRIQDEALRWLLDPPRVGEMRRQLSDVRGRLGDGGATRRAAREVLAVIEGRS